MMWAIEVDAKAYGDEVDGMDDGRLIGLENVHKASTSDAEVPDLSETQRTEPRPRR